MPGDSQARNPVDEAAEDFARRLRLGETVEIAEYAERYPEHSVEIRRLLPAVAALERCRIQQSATSAPGTAVPVGRLPADLGNYRLLREIGRGGMGIVYEAEQRALGRCVAVKVLSPALNALESQQARFRREAAAAARLHHTNIVPVFGAEQADGVSFYAMQLIAGKSLAELLAERDRRATPAPHAETAVYIRSKRAPADGAHPLSQESRRATGLAAAQTVATRGKSTDVDAVHGSPTVSDGRIVSRSGARHAAIALPPRPALFAITARLGMQAAQALAYAHSQGVLHRDVKPFNLIVDGALDVWLADFGLAKILDAEDLTVAGECLGTTRYLAPERLEGRCDARSDLMALGLTLYEVLAGRPACDGADRAAVLQQVPRADPPGLPRLSPGIPRDLETIVHKAIARDPERRYQTGSELAEDLRRFLTDEPILARRSSPAERFMRICRRNPLMAIMTAVVLLLIVTLAGVSSRAAWKLAQENSATRTQLRRAEKAEAGLEKSLAVVTRHEREKTGALFDSHIASATAMRRSRAVGQRLDALTSLAAAATLAHELDLPPIRYADLRREAVAALAHPDLRMVHETALLPDDVADCGAFNGDLSICAWSSSDGRISVRNMEDGRELAARSMPLRTNHSLTMSSDGEWVVPHFSGIAWGWRTDRIVSLASEKAKQSRGVEFSSDSRRLAVSYDKGRVVLFDLKGGGEIDRLETGLAGEMRIAFSPDERRLAVSCWPARQVQIHQIADGAMVRRFSLPCESGAVAWHPDGRRLAAAGEDMQIRQWDVESGRSLMALRGHQRPAHRLAFHAAGDLLLSSSWEGIVRLWNPYSGVELLRGEGMFGQWSRDGTRLVWQQGRRLQIFELERGGEYRTIGVDFPTDATGYGVNDASLSADRRWLAVGGAGGAWICDVEGRLPTAFIPAGNVQEAVVCPELSKVWTTGRQGLTAWPLQISDSALQVGAPHPHLPQGNYLDIVPCGDSLIAADWSRGAIIYDSARYDAPPRVLAHPGVHKLALSPDGRWLVTAPHNGQGVRLWNFAESSLQQDLWPEAQTATAAFSPEGRRLAAGSGLGLRLWNSESWTVIRTESRIRPYPAIAWSPDGTIFAVAVSNWRVELQRPDDGRVLAELDAPDDHKIDWLAFTRGGAQLLMFSMEPPHLRLWDLTRVNERLAELGLAWTPPGTAAGP